MKKTIKILFFILICFLPKYIFSQNNYDLVNVSMLDSTIIIDLKYATSDNFMGEVLYSANICLLRRPIAEKIVKVNQQLKLKGYKLKIWDGYRPLEVQKKMWAKMPKPGFVANPKYGSNHNRGAAVDVTLLYLNGNEVIMPTMFDDFSDKAASSYQELPDEVLKNRKILQDVMKSNGFKTIKSEWWHFNYKDIKKYSIIDVPLENFLKEQYDRSTKSIN